MERAILPQYPRIILIQSFACRFQFPSYCRDGKWGFEWFTRGSLCSVCVCKKEKKKERKNFLNKTKMKKK